MTVLIAKTNSLQANLTQKLGWEIGIQLEGTNARKWKDLCKLGTQSQQCSKLKLGELNWRPPRSHLKRAAVIHWRRKKRHRKRQETMNIFLEMIAPKASDKKKWPDNRFLVMFNVLIFGEKTCNFLPRKDAWRKVCCKVLKKIPQVCRISKSWCLGPWINVSSAATNKSNSLNCQSVELFAPPPFKMTHQTNRPAQGKEDGSG